MIYYSKSTKGFYCTEIHGTNIPSDCVEISVETHQRLLEEQSRGKQIVPDKDGYPIAVVPPAVLPTWEQIRAKRDSLLKDSDWVVLADSNPKPSKEAWLTYRQALRDLPQNFETPEEVIWPELPK